MFMLGIFISLLAVEAGSLTEHKAHRPVAFSNKALRFSHLHPLALGLQAGTAKLAFYMVLGIHAQVPLLVHKHFLMLLKDANGILWKREYRECWRRSSFPNVVLILRYHKSSSKTGGQESASHFSAFEVWMAKSYRQVSGVYCCF